MVINKFNNEHRWFRYFECDETKAWIMNTKQVDKKRKEKAKHVAFSASVENAWQRRSVGTVVVNKPGFPTKYVPSIDWLSQGHLQ